MKESKNKQKTNTKFKKFLTILLVFSLGFTNKAIFTFAEDLDITIESDIKDTEFEIEDGEISKIDNFVSESIDNTATEEVENTKTSNEIDVKNDNEEEIDIDIATDSDIEEMDTAEFGDTTSWMYFYDTDSVTTLHLTSTGGTGRTPISVNNGVIEYTGKVNNFYKLAIKKIIIDDNIVAQTCNSMFDGFNNVTSIEHLERLDTSSVTDMSYMFAYMYNPAATPFALDLNSLDTSNVTTMEGMFKSSGNLSSLDLSSFDTSKVTNMKEMFKACSYIVTIKVSDSFVTTATTESTDMFASCTRLEGGNGTQYDNTNPTDKTYARIDGGSSAPGYFTGEAITGISVSSPSTTDSYMSGDSFNAQGLVITVVYSDGSTKEVSYDSNPTAFTFTPSIFTNSSTTVTIKYREFTTTQPVTVTPKIVTQILEVKGFKGQTDTAPAYIETGSAIDLTNVKVRVKYDNNTEEELSYDPINPTFSFWPNNIANAYTTYKIIIDSVEKELDESILYVYRNSIDDCIRITNITGPTKTVYTEHECFDPTGMEIDAVDFFSNSTNHILYDNTTESKFEFDPNLATSLSFGTTEVEVQYGDYKNCKSKVNIIVLKRARDLSMVSGLIKTYYTEGDTFDASCIDNDFQITVRNEDNTTENVKYIDHPNYFTFEPALGTSLTTANEKVVVKYAGASMEFDIVVEPIANATAITQKTAPTKVNYLAGEPFNPTGLEINVTYPGNITKIIQYNSHTRARFSFVPDINTGTLTYGTNTVSVTYKGATTTIPVTVRKQMTELTQIVTNPTNIEYLKGDKFDPTGLIVKVKYNDNSTEDIPYDNAHKDLFTFTPDLTHSFDNTDVGKKVKVSLGGVPAIDITGMESIYADSVAIVYQDATGNTKVEHNITKDAFTKAVEDEIKKGAIGFYEYDASGLKDAKAKYNKYTAKTLTKDEAIAKHTTTGLTKTIYIASVYENPTPAPKTKGGNSSSQGGGTGGIGISYDSQGNIQPGLPNNTQETLNTTNNIPQNRLINNATFINYLQAYQENKTVEYTNIKDDKGNKGYGKWQHIPNTTMWYFLSGNYDNQNHQKGTTGLVSDGWYNLSWKGKDCWYHFDKNGMMQLGWFTENNKIYYLEENPNSSWYGRSVTGQYTVNGQKYNFDSSGALIP